MEQQNTPEIVPINTAQSEGEGQQKTREKQIKVTPTMRAPARNSHNLRQRVDEITPKEERGRCVITHAHVSNAVEYAHVLPPATERLSKEVSIYYP